MGDSDFESIHRLVSEKDKAYGETWRVASAFITQASWGEWRIFATVYVYLWMMIVNKMCRLLQDPYNMDTWKDIQGYAQLAVNDLRELELLASVQEENLD